MPEGVGTRSCYRRPSSFLWSFRRVSRVLWAQLFAVTGSRAQGPARGALQQPHGAGSAVAGVLAGAQLPVGPKGTEDPEVLYPELRRHMGKVDPNRMEELAGLSGVEVRILGTVAAFKGVAPQGDDMTGKGGRCGSARGWTLFRYFGKKFAPGMTTAYLVTLSRVIRIH